MAANPNPLDAPRTSAHSPFRVVVMESPSCVPTYYRNSPAKKVAKQLQAGGGAVTLRVELHALDRVRPVAQTHQLAPPQPAPPEQELSWADAGPVGTEEEAGCYRHDSGISVTWVLDLAPLSQP